jgi:hypothetical protein
MEAAFETIVVPEFKDLVSLRAFKLEGYDGRNVFVFVGKLLYYVTRGDNPNIGKLLAGIVCKDDLNAFTLQVCKTYDDEKELYYVRNDMENDVYAVLTVKEFDEWVKTRNAAQYYFHFHYSPNNVITMEPEYHA